MSNFPSGKWNTQGSQGPTAQTVPDQEAERLQWREDQRKVLTSLVPHVEKLRTRLLSFLEKETGDSYLLRDQFEAIGLIGALEIVLRDKDEYPEDAIAYLLERAFAIHS